MTKLDPQDYTTQDDDGDAIVQSLFDSEKLSVEDASAGIVGESFKNNDKDNEWGTLIESDDGYSFERYPEVLNKVNFRELLRKLYAIDVDDVMLTGGFPIEIQVHGEAFQVSQRALSTDELSNLLADIHMPSTVGVIKTGERDVNFAYPVPISSTESVRFRVNVSQVMGPFGSFSFSMTMRAIDSEPKTMDELALPKALRDILFPSSGIVIVTGETGSGKTTLLGSVIRHESTAGRGKQIITYESPIEYDFNSVADVKICVKQTEVGFGGMLPTYEDAVSNLIRRNPHIVLFGECTTVPTIRGVNEAAKSGHRVYTTLHAGGVALAVARMTDGFSPGEKDGARDSLTDSIRGVVHQRLLKKKGGGRVPVIEWIDWNADVRDELFSCSGKDYIPTVRRLTETHGQPLIIDLKAKEDLIDPDDYRLTMRDLEREVEREKRRAASGN